MIPTVLLTISGSILISKTTNTKKIIKNTFIVSMISLISIFIITLIPPRIKNITEYEASYAEYLPKEVNKEYIKNRNIIITSNNQTKHTFQKKGTEIQIEFEQNDNDTDLELPLIYYKGYNASINEKQLEVYKTENGLLGVKIKDIKSGTIKVSYKGTTLARITKIISLTSFIIFTIYIIKEVKHEK